MISVDLTSSVGFFCIFLYICTTILRGNEYEKYIVRGIPCTSLLGSVEDAFSFNFILDFILCRKVYSVQEREDTCRIIASAKSLMC